MVTEHEASDALCGLLGEVHFCFSCNAKPCMECEQMLAALGLPRGTSLPKLVADARAVANHHALYRAQFNRETQRDWFRQLGVLHYNLARHFEEPKP